MPNTYGGGSSPPRQIDIPDTILTEIGRLVRACAEIEDLVFLYICNLAEISPSRAAVILGRSTITRRLEMAEYLAKMTGKKITELHKSIFGQEFKDVQFCRNAVCHGKYLGVSDDGSYAFLIQKTEDPVGESAIQIVTSYQPDVITHLAKSAEGAIPQIEKLLKLEALRQERDQKPLLPHRKHQIRNRSRSKAKTQPRSSKG